MCKPNQRKLTILFGSQTGNAQDISERIWRESKRFHFIGSVKSMDDYNIAELINESCVIFVCSTTGQGEEPDNMKTFWKFLLRRNLSPDSLANLKCSVLGLGDSSYTKFNFVAKRLNKRLMQLGADIILPVALGDDQHDLGYDAVVDVWIETLWSKLLELYPLPKDLKPLSSNAIIKPRWQINAIGNDSLDSATNNASSIYFNDSTKTPEDQFWVEVKDNTRTTSASHFQDVRLIKFATKGQQYQPGDVLNVRPHNSKELVNEFLDVLKTNGVNIKPETVFKISEIDADMPVPVYLQNNITFQTLCEQYFDLSAIPRRYVFSVLAQLTTSDLEREKCQEFNTAEGQNDLYSYCNRPRRNITEVLRDFPHAVENITIEMLFEILPPIKSRAFSIASSCKAHENEIHVLVAVVKYKTKLVKERLGLCSNWLADLNVGEKIPVWIKKGSFRFPTDQDCSIIMVGPGTGVAPFRSFICETEKTSEMMSNKFVLYFGCRNHDHDYHCKEDFEKFEKDGKLTLICAFSRDQEDKIYVQHKIEEHGQKMWDLLKSKKSFIFIAGNSKNMPQAVREAFVSVCKKFNRMSEEEAENFICLLERNGQFQTETWA